MLRRSIAPDAVHDMLRRHLLVDGYPMVIDLERSHGSWVRDAKSGRELLDFFSFFASNPIGFNHPSMAAPAVQERLARAATVKVSNADYYTPFMAELVDMLERTAAPPELPHWFFIDGGALAVENGMKAAFDWKVRKNLARGAGERGSQVLHLRHAFHGRSGYTLSCTNTDPAKTQYFPRFDWPRIPSPAIEHPLEGERLDRVQAAEAEAIAAAERYFDQREGDIAAILVEPIQAEGGDRHFRPQFLAELRRLADEREALLIFDEVQTGLGITGSWWAFQQLGVVPDIVCFAKKMQVGGIFVSRRIDEVADNVFVKPSRINSTWGSSLSDMVRCTHILEIIVEERLLENAAARGAELHAGLQALAGRLGPQVSNVRGRGLMCALDVPSKDHQRAVVRACFDGGMIILPCGDRGLRFRPALNVTAENIAEGVRRLGGALEGVFGAA
ncbi:MAG: L-lysine 6-transaminase [Polyangiaceae bacterium]|nr:L-lysine 6-transaminase [Polyangiaceae bacterium]